MQPAASSGHVSCAGSQVVVRHQAWLAELVQSSAPAAATPANTRGALPSIPVPARIVIQPCTP